MKNSGWIVASVLGVLLLCTLVSPWWGFELMAGLFSGLVSLGAGLLSGIAGLFAGLVGLVVGLFGAVIGIVVGVGAALIAIPMALLGAIMSVFFSLLPIVVPLALLGVFAWWMVRVGLRGGQPAAAKAVEPTASLPALPPPAS